MWEGEVKRGERWGRKERKGVKRREEKRGEEKERVGEMRGKWLPQLLRQ